MGNYKAKEFNCLKASKRELVDEIIMELSSVSSWIIDCRKNIKKTEIDEETRKILQGHLANIGYYIMVLSEDNQTRIKSGLSAWK